MDTYVDIPRMDNLSQMGYSWLNSTLPDFDFSHFVEEISSGKNVFNPDNIFNSLIAMFANELYAAVKILTVITAIMLISALLENLRSSFNKTTLFSGMLLAMILLPTSFSGALLISDASAKIISIHYPLTK